MTAIDIFVLVFGGVLIIVAARLLDVARRIVPPSRADILARFDHRPSRLWLSLGALVAVDATLLTLAFLAFGSQDEALLGFGAHGWAWGFTLSASAALVTVVLGTVLRVYLSSR